MLQRLPVRGGDDLLIGLAEPDDAAVYRLDAERAVAATLDFFTPLVDEPRDFGAIAAANALSDLYAMGARPLFALNVLAIPAGEFPDGVVAEILAGATEVCDRAGIAIAGGHSIDDPEPKYGLVALGLVHPDRVLRKGGGRPGDVLVLGKALGTGVVTTGIKRRETAPEVRDAAVASMTRLNDRALEALEGVEVHALTDVSGFGLLGHVREICRASGVGARIRADGPLLLPGARELARRGCVPGGTVRNREGVRDLVEWADAIPEDLRVLLCDAQTSGGLLAAVPAEQGARLREAWEAEGYAASVVGALEAGGPLRIRVVRGEAGGGEGEDPNGGGRGGGGSERDRPRDPGGEAE